MSFTKEEKLLLLITTIYTLAATMASTFVNVYLFNYTNSHIIANIYQMVRLAMIGVAAVIAAKLSCRLKMSVTLTLGLISITTSVIVLLYLRENIADNLLYIYLIAFLLGLGEGFFWISLNTLTQLITSPENRGPYLGIYGALANFATIIAPLLSSYILSWYVIELDGYYTMFKVVIAMFVAISGLSTLIKSPIKKEPFSVLRNLKEALTDLQWRFVLRTQFFWGVREAAVMSLAGLLIYEAIGSASAYGRISSAFALIATISNYVMGHVVKKSNRVKFLLIGTVGIFASGMALAFGPGLYGAISHGVLANTFFSFMNIPFSIMSMNIISDYMHNENIIGRMSCKEIVMAFGRVAGLTCLIIIATIYPGTKGLTIALVFLYLFNLLIGLSTLAYDHKKHPRIH